MGQSKPSASLQTTKPRGVVDTSDSHAAIEKYLDSLEKSADRASIIQGKADKTGIVQPGEDKTQRDLITVHKYLIWGIQMIVPDSSQWYQVTGEEAIDIFKIQEKPFKHKCWQEGSLVLLQVFCLVGVLLLLFSLTFLVGFFHFVLFFIWLVGVCLVAWFGVFFGWLVCGFVLDFA